MGALQIDYVQAHELASIFREINFARFSDNMIDDIALRGFESNLNRIVLVIINEAD